MKQSGIKPIFSWDFVLSSIAPAAGSSSESFLSEEDSWLEK